MHPLTIWILFSATQTSPLAGQPMFRDSDTTQGLLLHTFNPVDQLTSGLIIQGSMNNGDAYTQLAYGAP
jgi:hypothetical protein